LRADSRQTLITKRSWNVTRTLLSGVRPRDPIDVSAVAKATQASAGAPRQDFMIPLQDVRLDLIASALVFHQDAK